MDVNDQIPIKNIDILELCNVYDETLGSAIQPSEYNKSYREHLTYNLGSIKKESIALKEFLNIVSLFFERGTYYFLRFEHLEKDCFDYVTKEDLKQLKEYLKFHFYMGCSFNFVFSQDYNTISYKRAILMQNLSSLRFEDISVTQAFNFLKEHNISTRQYELTLNFTSDTNLNSFLYKIVSENKMIIYEEIGELLKRNYKAIKDFHTISIQRLIERQVDYLQSLVSIESSSLVHSF